MIKLADIDLGGISTYRGQQMGVAMIIIMFFHVYLSRWSPFYGLYRMGNVGVDIFLFLSGVGLWFSWVKTPSLKHFFARRYMRVYPAWFVIALLFYGQRFNGNWLYLIDNITINWNFWRYGELTFWFLPAIMLLYAFAPFYIKLIRQNNVYRWLPVMMIVWSVMVQWIPTLHANFNHLEIFWSRIPIFLIGINMGESVMGKRTIKGNSTYLLILFFALTLGSSIYLEQQLHGKFPLFIERMLYIPLTITFVLLLNNLLKYSPVWLNKAFAFIGTISLEVYLIHVEFVLKPLQQQHLGYWLTLLLTIIISLPLAWLLHKAIVLVEKYIKRVNA